MTDSKIRGLIFDCDGTLVDTMPLHWRAWNSVCDRHGIVFPEERFYALGGVPSVKILHMLKKEQELDFERNLNQLVVWRRLVAQDLKPNVPNRL